MFSVKLVLSLALLSVVNSQGLIPGVSNQCFEKVSPGPCRAFIPQFYFNHQTGMCDCFVFGGCQGNNNKFARLDQCMNTCNVNPTRQVISTGCIRIFGADNSNFVQSPKPITQAPIANPEPIIATFPAVPGKTLQQAVTPATEAPVTAAPTTAVPNTAAPITAAPTTATPATAAPATASPASAAPITAAPVTTAPATTAPVTSATFIASAPIVTSSSTTVTQGNIIVTKSTNGVFSKGVVGVIFTKNGVTGETTIHIGQPIFITQRTGESNDDDDDK